MSHSSDRHRCQSADTLAPVHLWFLVTPEGKLRAKELTACLPSISNDFPSVSLTLHFYSFCLFSLEPLAVFFQPVSSCSFLAISLTPGDFVHSFVIPGLGAIQQIYGSDQCWLPGGVASSAAEGSYFHSGLWQQHPSRLLLFIQAIDVFHVPRIMVFQPVFNIFLCLVICSPSCVMNLSPIVLLAMWVCQRKLAVVLLSMALAQRWCHLTEWRLFNG